MKIFTDDTGFGERLFGSSLTWSEVSSKDASQAVGPGESAAALFSPGRIFFAQWDHDGIWSHAFVVKHAPRSQFDVMVEFIRSTPDFPDGLLCLAGSGEKFHGQRSRPWKAREGNIHLTAVLRPEKEVANFHAAFPAWAGISVVETIDRVEGLAGKAGIKWVNDILIGNAKVAGFIGHAQRMEEVVKSTVLGIGLNVESSPGIPCDRFVPETSFLRSLQPDPDKCNLNIVLSSLLKRLERNYRIMLKGDWMSLLESYRLRSRVIGKRVEIHSDPIEGKSTRLSTGIAIGIGDDLAVILDGGGKPIASGRLILCE